MFKSCERIKKQRCIWFLIFYSTVLLTPRIQRAVAQNQTNEAPTIVSPVANFTLTTPEGKAIAIPIEIIEPENEQVTYTLEHAPGDNNFSSTLPDDAYLSIDPNTAAKAIHFWPSLTDAGVHQFRITVSDEQGNTTSHTATVTVTDHTVGPVMKIVKRDVGFHSFTDKLLLPGENLVIGEISERIRFTAEGFHPNGLEVTLAGDVAGIDDDTFSGGGTLTWTTSKSPIGEHQDEGTHAITITATASDGTAVQNNTVTVTPTFDTRAEQLRLLADPIAGALRGPIGWTDITGATDVDDDTKSWIVAGNVTFQPNSLIIWSSQGRRPDPPVGDEVTVDWWLELPAERKYVGRTTGMETVSYDFSGENDGWGALVPVIYKAPTDDWTYHFARWYPHPTFLMIDNDGQPNVAGPVPSIYGNGMRSNWHGPNAIKWHSVTDITKDRNPHALTYDPTPGFTTEEQRQAFVADESPDSWFPYPFLGPLKSRYDPIFMPAQTAEGHIGLARGYTRIQADPRHAPKSHATDGPRHVAAMMPYGSVRADPAGPGYVMISRDSRLFKIDPTQQNILTTIAGYVNKPGVLPYNKSDASGAGSVTNELVYANQKDLIGNWQTPDGTLFNYPQGLVFDTSNPNIIYVSNTNNHNILKIDRSTNPATITHFAGGNGEDDNGFVDGPAATARFDEPWGMAMIGRLIHVMDSNNLAVRTIDADTGEVSTLIGGPTVTPDECKTNPGVKNNPDLCTPASTPIEDGFLVQPHHIHELSDGTFVFGEGYSKRIRHYNSIAGTIDFVATFDGKDSRSFSVDKHGVMGPKDNIIMNDADGHDFRRISVANGTENTILREAGYPLAFTTDVQFPTDYGESLNGVAFPIAFAVDDTNAEFLYTQVYQDSAVLFRPRRPTDPSEEDIDFDISSRGKQLYFASTIPEFMHMGSSSKAGAIMKNRPSVAALVGVKGASRIGNVPGFDDLRLRSNEGIFDFYRDGEVTGVPLPEMTGRDLQAITYYTRLLSRQAQDEVIDLAAIGQDITTAGLGDVTDFTQAEIRDVQVFKVTDSEFRIDFKTDKPTIAGIHMGPDRAYGIPMTLETGYSKDHSITVSGLPADIAETYHFQIRVKDLAGNQTVTEDALLSGEAPPKTVDICTTLKHRTRKGRNHDLSIAALTITDEATSTVVVDTTLSMDNAQGRVRLTDMTGVVDDITTSYTIRVKPRGHISVTKTGVTDLQRATCVPLGTAPPGDFNEDNDRIDLAELVMAVRHFRQGGEAILQDIYRYSFVLSDLVSLVNTYVGQG